MTKHTWTPDAVHELVKDWPDEARAAIGWAPESHQWVQFDDTPLLSYLAAAAHVESGLEWLAMGDCTVPSICYIEGATNLWTLANEICDMDWESGPTLLHAVSAAIMAAGGGRP